MWSMLRAYSCVEYVEDLFIYESSLRLNVKAVNIAADAMVKATRRETYFPLQF